MGSAPIRLGTATNTWGTTPTHLGSAMQNLGTGPISLATASSNRVATTPSHLGNAPIILGAANTNLHRSEGTWLCVCVWGGGGAIAKGTRPYHTTSQNNVAQHTCV